MAKNPNVRKTGTWTQSKRETISILTKKIQKVKVDQNIKALEVNDFYMGIHSSVSWFRLLTFKKKNTFPDNSNGLCHLFVE